VIQPPQLALSTTLFLLASRSDGEDVPLAIRVRVPFVDPAFLLAVKRMREPSGESAENQSTASPVVMAWSLNHRCSSRRGRDCLGGELDQTICPSALPPTEVIRLLLGRAWGGLFPLAAAPDRAAPTVAHPAITQASAEAPCRGCSAVSQNRMDCDGSDVS